MTLSFHHILVPYDGSRRGERAFRGALQIAKKFESKITILSCVERNPTFVFFEIKADKKEMKKRQRMIQEKISQLKQIAENSGIQCNSKVNACTLASSCIVSYANSHKIDLIVMSRSAKINPEKIYHESTVN